MKFRVDIFGGGGAAIMIDVCNLVDAPFVLLVTPESTAVEPSEREHE